MKHCIVIGGGIIGLCTAYYLLKDGHQVTIIDKSNLDSGASYVNAGFLSPSHIIPLSAPGVMKQGLKWMFDSSSPLYIQPRLKFDFLKWVWAFQKSCNTQHVQKSATIIRDIAVWSQELYGDILKSENFKSHYEKKGLLVLCQTEKMWEEESKVVEFAQRLGLNAIEIDKKKIKKMEPKVEINAIGGAYFKGDHHATPNEFMHEMKSFLKLSGVQFVKNQSVEDFDYKHKKITNIKTNKGRFKADEFIIASGSWSAILCKKLDLNILLQAGKGYRINTLKSTGITIPSILSESKVAVTPMHGFTRFAGTMEIAGINHKINTPRVDAIAKAVRSYYPEIKLTSKEKNDVACGLRPVSPDGLPYIGKSKKYQNLTLATGHAMMGWSMATGTGKLVSEIISEQKTTLNLKAFYPDRKF